MTDNLKIRSSENQLSGKYIAPEGWGRRAYSRLQSNQGTQKNRIDPGPGNVWLKDRAKDKNSHNRVDKHAGDKINTDNNHDHPQLCWSLTKKRRKDLLWYLQKAYQPGKCLPCADENEDHSSYNSRLQKCIYGTRQSQTFED